MENSITISAQFDFRGKTFRPAITLELDWLMERGAELPDYHQRLAAENGIDPYSYEYEVLESSELVFENATGLAAEYVMDGHFDFEGFRQRWLEQSELGALERIARKHLGVEQLDQQPALKGALLEAYRLGKQG